MSRLRLKVTFILITGFVSLLNLHCGSPNEAHSESANPPFLNLDTATQYVGKETCRSCHPAIYESFMQTGMGQSFAGATPQKSAARFHQKPVYDKSNDMYYIAHWMADSMYITEFRLKGKDTIHKRTERVDYIIGSGQHTNSHLTLINGFLYQLPLTWYAQKQQWDLPPGFENGRNVRFSRAIEFECLSCHNAYPALTPGSVNHYNKIPEGIDCERCHGPGEIHVREKLKGIRIDTANEIDYTIVNPRKLDWERQTDVCQRCHLQGNAVLKPGKTFKDFKPGMRLHEVVEVFMPRYKGAENEFIMASHAQRLRQSRCFIGSNTKEKKNADEKFARYGLTCITCHNPHVSVKKNKAEVFNAACLNCHTNQMCKEGEAERQKQNNNCIACHMPGSGSTDIPHVQVHDHKIRIVLKEDKLNAIKTFAGLYCVNNDDAGTLARAQAFLNYYEKFEGETVSLDSAVYYFNTEKNNSTTLAGLIHASYLQNNWNKVIELSKNLKPEEITDAWQAYRIGQAWQNAGDAGQSIRWYERALALAPFNLDFRNKLGVALVSVSGYEEAEKHFRYSLLLQPKQEDVWVNLGFVCVTLNKTKEALAAYNEAIRLYPDHAQALLNRAALYHLMNDDAHAREDLKHILQKDPNREEVKALLKSLNSSRG